LVAVIVAVPALVRAANDTKATDAEREQAAQRERVETLRKQAAEALAKSDWSGARALYDRLLAISPHDADAQRDAGRAALAATDFVYAARVLELAHHFAGHHRDPELHYLRGEALFALERVEEARSEHRIAELEIGVAPKDRMQKLWQARIYARRGELHRADSVYESLWPPAGAAPDAEVAVNHADAHLLWRDWAGAERLLKRFLERDPGHVRARHMLAWALEAQGKLPEELAVRSRLATDDPSLDAQRDYGRALERAGDDAQALRAYRSAAAVAAGPDATLIAARDRMRYRLTPEVTGAFGLRTDPLTTAQRAQAGAALPFGSRHLVSMLFSHDAAQGGLPSAETGVSAVTGSLLLGARFGGTLLLAGQARGLTQTPAVAGTAVQAGPALRFGGIGEVDTPLGPPVRVNVRGELENQWAEAPTAVRENGATTGVTAQLYVYPIPSNRRLILLGGTQARRLFLAPGVDGGARPEASQSLSWAGADVVMWQDATRALRGQALNDSLTRRSDMAESVVLSARHYELFGRSDPEFDRRLMLLPRAAVTIGTVAMRTVLGARLGLELRGGVGYESLRKKFLSQVGGTMAVATSRASRVSASYDFAQETMTGFVGRRHTGWVAYHVDL
jgi:tetratricopeptide (TPR) repeat protein